MIITLRESKAKLSALVDMAARGEEVVITVRGRPMARLCAVVSPSPRAKRGHDSWRRRLCEARAAYSVGIHDTGAEILDELRGDRT